MADFIPLTTFDYKLAFCQATNELPRDIQQIIWAKTLETTAPRTPPGAPIRPSRRLEGLMNNWKRRRINF